MTQPKYTKIAGIDRPANIITTRLAQLLHEGRRILLLIPGGSAIDLAVKSLAQLDSPGDLAITLTDERYGERGHRASNWQQLKEHGMGFGRWNCHEILEDDDIDSATHRFSDFLNAALAEKRYVLGLFGLGPDGHTAGLLPGSPALDSGQLADHYRAPDFERITITPRFLKHLDEAFIFAMGDNKAEQLDRLSQDLDTRNQPAQLLKQAKLLTVFNDYRGN